MTKKRTSLEPRAEKNWPSKAKQFESGIQVNLPDTECDNITAYSGHQTLWGGYFRPPLHREQTFQGRKPGKSRRLRWDLAVLREGYLREGIWRATRKLTPDFVGWGIIFWVLCSEVTEGQKKKCVSVERSRLDRERWWSNFVLRSAWRQSWVRLWQDVSS